MTDECRIYLDPKDETVFAIVSPEDYQWCLQWRWHFTWDKHRRKRYATRVTRTVERPRSHKLYLHKLILNRSGKVQPTERHTIGDHQNGDSLDCQRDNLEWATPSMNAINRRKPVNDNYANQKAA